MASNKGSRLFDRVDQLEYRWCMTINQILHYRGIHAGFSWVSRLGDGWFWYGLIFLVPFIDPEGGPVLSLAMALTGATGALLYKILKSRLVRERPFISFPGISCGTPPLDRYSFPSGHTLHAVAFTTLLFSTLPWVALAVLPFTLAVMASRVVLGLHYPSDVAAGALIGLLLALLAMQFF